MLSGDDMATEIFEALVASGAYAPITNPADPALDKVLVGMKVMYNAMVAHITTNMEISGVQVSDPAETVETYVAGSGDNGGALAGQIPIVGSVRQAAKTRTQSNDGTGRVS